MMCTLSQEEIDAILAQGKIFEVGGAVRDSLLNMPLDKDRDYLVTGIEFDKLTRILNRHGRVDLVGKSFGVIKFTQFSKERQKTFDIALPRSEHSTGLGHKEFAIDYDPNLPIEDDLVRRDFTINAMARPLDSDNIVDPLDGQIDLRKRQIRMTSADSFIDDPLRMLRAVQFAARLEFSIEPTTLKAIAENSHLISTVSAERVAEELNKLLEQAKRPSEGFRVMQTTGLLKQILPELEACVDVTQPGGFHKYDVFEHTLHVIDAAPMKKRIRLAALFHDITKPSHRRLLDDGGSSYYGHETSGAKVTKEIMARLRFSNDLTRDVATLVKRHMFPNEMSDKARRRLIKWVGKELIFELLDLRRADIVGLGMGHSNDDVDCMEQDIREELLRKPPFSVSDLAINGDDVMGRFNLSESPIIGRIMHQLLEAVLDRPELNTNEDLFEIAQDFINKQIDSKNMSKGEDRN